MKTKLRIAMICDPIGDYKAGAIVSALRFSKLLKERGHHVIFIGAKTAEHQNHTYTLGIKTYRYRSIPLPKSGGWYLAFPTVTEVKKVFIEEKIDIIHVILPMSGAIIAIQAAKSLGIQIVAHSHSQPENVFMDAPSMLRPAIYSLWNSYLAWIYSKSDFIIYPSKMAYDLLHHLTSDGKPSEVISNGVDIEEFKPTDCGDFYERYSIPKINTILVYVGRLFPEKSVDTLIEAMPYIMDKHEKTHVVIIGGGHLREALEDLAVKKNLKDHISFLGLISDEDRLLGYNAADIFVSPSLAELEGMTVLEAMACGKPIIVPDTTMNAARFFIEDNGLLFEASNPKDLAKKISILITDEELRKKMGEASLRKSKLYDIKKSVSTLENVYYKTMSI